MDLFEKLQDKIRNKDHTVVFPEGEDLRVLTAAVRFTEDGLGRAVLLGDTKEIKDVAVRSNLSLDKVTIIDPKTYPKEDHDEMVSKLVQRRKGKNTAEEAEKMIEDVNYFGTMLVYMGKADSMVSGAVHATSDTVRPALQIIKTKPGMKRISGSFIMQRGDERYLFGDCAINIDPDPETLAEIAIQSAQTARMFDIDPKVSLMSFSTKGSASGPMVDKVKEATKIAQTRDPKTPIDGELQFDASFVPVVAEQKTPDSKVAGRANVFIFPELQSGNIGYKIAQRLGGFEAIGPVLQGLNAPVSDLSRGASEEDIYKVAILTASLVEE